MIYEYLVHEAPLRPAIDRVIQVLHARLPLFERHGMRVVGTWTTNRVTENSNDVVCLIEFEDLAHYERAWASFRADPEVEEITRAIIGDGVWVERVSNYILEPTSYCPAVV